MAKTMLNVKADVEVKKAAQRIAKEMGVPLSTIVNAQLKRFVRERRLELSVPVVYLKGKAAKRLDKMVEKGMKDYVEGRTRTISSLADLD